MAVEGMKIVSVIGKLKDLDRIAREFVLNGDVHMLNSISEIHSNCFEIEASESNAHIVKELSDIRPYEKKRDYSNQEEILKSFFRIFDMKANIEEKYLWDEYEFEEISGKLIQQYGEVKGLSDAIGQKQEKIAELQQYMENLSYVKNSGMDIGTVLDMRYLDFMIMSISKENFQKLKLNYENIPAVVFEVARIDKKVIIIAFTAERLREESIRIFESLNYTELYLPKGYRGTAEEVIKALNAEIAKLKAEIEELKSSAREYKNEFGEDVQKAYTLLELEKKMEHVKSEAALGQNLFFLFGFVPDSRIESFSRQLRTKFEAETVLISEDVENRPSGHAPPTRLRNMWLFRPFEYLVAMYGIPSYNELDPTPFFGLSYMLMFGAMFGDIGQGLVIALAGLLLRYKLKNIDFGGILTRLGLSSMFFGLLYGSVFGNEEIIKGLWLKPMDNIETILISAIVLGVILINISYIHGLINLYKRRDIEEGLFGREGAAGFLFFWTLILAIWANAAKSFSFPIPVALSIMFVFLMLIVFKQPLANKLKGHQELYEDSASDYYIEAGFGIIETLLSILSNVISFIRVGAFAINHVGLYIAFATMAEMAGSLVGSIIVLVLGNIIIIGLEGLIVFIQSLRLEYYELFSKFYLGFGIAYKPARLRRNMDTEGTS